MQAGGSSGNLYPRDQGDLVVYPESTPGFIHKARPNLVLRPNGTTVYPPEHTFSYNPNYFRRTKGVIIEHEEPPAVYYETAQPVQADQADELTSFAQEIKGGVMEEFRSHLAAIEWILRKQTSVQAYPPMTIGRETCYQSYSRDKSS